MHKINRKLSIVIMAHPERQEWAKELSQKLGAPIVYDRINNVWDTCRRAWLSQVSIGSEYTLVLQDDAIVCDNFIKEAEAVLNDDFVYSLYVGKLLKNRADMALKKGEDRVLATMILNEVAICMKTTHIEDMVRFCDERNAQNDQYISRWAGVARKKVCYPLPGLVDHREGVSLYRSKTNRPNPEEPRRAISFKQ